MQYGDFFVDTWEYSCTLRASVWQPAELSTTPEYLGGACVVTTSYSADCVIAHAKGHAPPKSSGVFLLAPTVLRTLASTYRGGAEEKRYW